MYRMIDYIVQPEDTFYSIARLFDISPELLRAANPDITDVDSISAGQKIIIPESKEMRRTIDVNGYVFPTVNSQVLAETLPYLTYLSIFSYHVTASGSLTQINDTPLIQASRNAGVAPLMVITNMDGDGRYSSDLAHTILTDAQLQQTILNTVINKLKSQNYYGLNIDFGFIYPSDFPAYARFVHMAVQKLHPLGYIVVVAIMPDVAVEQPGLLSERLHDGEYWQSVDRIILRLGNREYAYAPPMAIAPVEYLSRTIDDVASVVPKSKLLIGVPIYFYDWTLPYQQGDLAQPLSSAQAKSLAQRTGAVINYDPESGALYFNYEDSAGAQHIVWYEEEGGIRTRFELVELHNLAGVSFWIIDYFFQINYQILDEMYDIRKVLTPIS